MSKQEKRKCTVCREIKRTTNKQEPYRCEDCLKEKGRELLSMPEDAMLIEPSANIAIPVEKVLNKGLALIIFLIGFFIGLVVRGLFK